MAMVSTPASAFGFVSASVHYSSSSGYDEGGNRVIIHQYPNGRVVVEHVPVVHVYPNGQSLIYQNGGQRVYSTGYGGASTCYVSCWHNGVNPTRRSGTQFSFSVGVQRTW